jgi:hypothetical protein
MSNDSRIANSVYALQRERDEALAKVAKLKAELKKWKCGCYANADDAKDAHRISDNQRLENLSLRAALKQCVEALEKTKALLEHETSKWDGAKTTAQHGLENWQWSCLKLVQPAIATAKPLLE